MSERAKKAPKAKAKPSSSPDLSFHGSAYVPLPGRKPVKTRTLWPLAALIAAGALAAAASYLYPYRTPEPAPAPVAAGTPATGPVELELVKAQRRNIKVIDRYNPFIRRNYPGRGLESTKVQFVGVGQDGSEVYSVVPPDGYEEKVRIMNQSPR